MNAPLHAETPQPKNNWPIWLFVACCLCLNVFIPSLIGWLDVGGFDDEIRMLLCFAGAICGECCFVVVLAALSRRTWFGGFLLGLLVTTLGFCCLTIGTLLNGEYDEEMPGAVALLPAFLLAATTPLYVFRQSQLRQWLNKNSSEFIMLQAKSSAACCRPSACCT